MTSSSPSFRAVPLSLAHYRRRHVDFRVCARIVHTKRTGCTLAVDVTDIFPPALEASCGGARLHQTFFPLGMLNCAVEWGDRGKFPFSWLAASIPRAKGQQEGSVLGGRKQTGNSWRTGIYFLVGRNRNWCDGCIGQGIHYAGYLFPCAKTLAQSNASLVGKARRDDCAAARERTIRFGQSFDLLKVYQL